MTTLALRIRDTATKHPDRIAMRVKRLGIWQQISWREYWEYAQLVGHGLLALGVEPGDRIGLHSENRPEWLYGDIGITAIRAITVGLYPTNPVAEVAHLLADSGCRVLIAEDQEQLDKALAVADELPELAWIVYLEPRGITGRYQDPRLLSWEEFCGLGAEHRTAHPGAVERIANTAEPDDVATLVYTSGTTGPPKGAMLTTANIEFAMDLLTDGGSFVDPPAGPSDQVVSYLPLSHVAERAFTTWMSAALGNQVNFAESIDTVQIAFGEVQPTLVFGVPRIWEKMAAAVGVRMAGASAVKRANYALWMALARWISRRLAANGGRHTAATRLAYALGWVFLYRALRERLGLRRTRYAASGAAPIAPEVLAFYLGIGVPMHEVYGMTENSAVATANLSGRVELGTVGEPRQGTELRIDTDTGEILTRHPGVFAGYWNNPAATAAAIDADGWLHTGDIGEWVHGTHVKITDRVKDIIITSGGKNIAPSEIENSLKASPYIKEAIVIGDGRKYLTALIGIELDTVGDWARRQKLAFTTYRDLTTKPEVRVLIDGIVKQTNTRLASVETIKRFDLLGAELDHDQGELTATQKVRRTVIAAAYADQIEAMYAGDEVSVR